jgi:hypothetical protein
MNKKYFLNMSYEITGQYKKDGVIEKVYVKHEGCKTKPSFIKRILAGDEFVVGSTKVKVVDDKYLRTDSNNTKSDNLGELDEKCKKTTLKWELST